MSATLFDTRLLPAADQTTQACDRRNIDVKQQKQHTLKASPVVLLVVTGIALFFPEYAPEKVAGLAGLWTFALGAIDREACTDCGACFRACPEPHIITPALKGSGTRLIVSGDCTNCGACIDSCYIDVFKFGTRLSAKHGAERFLITPQVEPAAGPSTASS